MSRVTLLSGGMDSVALAAWIRPNHAITVDYGQLPAAGEIRAARKICELLNIQHHIIAANCSSTGSGDLLGRKALAVAPSSEWWPFRNQLIITLAAAKAIEIGATEIHCGSVRTDNSHTDGTNEFYQKLDSLMFLQEGGLRIFAPAIDMTTTELIKKSGVSQTTLAWSHSCHVNEFACGRCRGCQKHRGVLQELGYVDEIIS